MRGKPLFPERVAQTVPYVLTELEKDLYERVTDYVRDGMNRAARLDGKRRNSVGFALTVLQRRLASSSEAIYKSLMRRAERLERRRKDILSGRLVDDALPPVDVDGLDDPNDEQAPKGEPKRGPGGIAPVVVANPCTQVLGAGPGPYVPRGNPDIEKAVWFELGGRGLSKVPAVHAG